MSKPFTVKLIIGFELPERVSPELRGIVMRFKAVEKNLLTAALENVVGDETHLADVVEALEQIEAVARRARASKGTK